jgi:HK97 family phage prohead protease
LKSEIKSIGAEIKDVSKDTRQVVKYVSVFDNVDSHGDIMQKGAYAKTIQENKDALRMYWNHNAALMPVGMPVEIKEDNYGLWVVTKLLDTTLGNDLLICYENGAVTEHSVGFYTKQKKNNAQGNRIITEVKLVEYSAVNQASNSQAKFLGFKSDESPLDQLAELNLRSENLYKTLTKGNVSDETCERLAVEHFLITKAMDDLIAALQVSEPVQDATQAKQEPQREEKSIDLLELFKTSYRG